MTPCFIAGFCLSGALDVEFLSHHELVVDRRYVRF